MRARLREARPEGEAAFYSDRYPGGYRHDVWPDHVERVAASVAMIRTYSDRIRSVADLSCGDAAIVRGLVGMKGFRRAVLGDLNGAAPGDWSEPVHWTLLPAGPLPDTLEHLDGEVDLFILSETLEHVHDPDDLLRRLADHARYLFLSTPVEESPDAGNLEHYWSWGTDDIHEMLTDAGWSPLERRILVPQSTRSFPHAYHYQMWMAVRGQ